jgi:hypothetical protein
MKGDKIKYRKGYKYVLAADYTLFTGITPPKSLVFKWAILSNNGYLTIIHDYPWDGASGPTIDTRDAMRGPLVHDVIYEMIRLGYLEPKWKTRADDLLKEILLEDGMNPIRAEIWEEGVEHFGRSSTLIDAEAKVLEAP